MYASDYRRIAREKLTGNWGLAVLTVFIATLLGGGISGFSFNFELSTDDLNLPEILVKLAALWGSIASILGFVQFIIGGPVQLGNCHFQLNLHDENHPDLKDLFSEFSRWGDAFVLKLLTTIYIFLWGLLLVIPGIVASYRYAMAPFIMAENPNMTGKEAIEASKAMMDGHKWELFCLDISFIGWAILSAITAGIGSLFLNPYVSAAHAAFYRQLSPAKVAEPEIPETNYIPPVEF